MRRKTKKRLNKTISSDYLITIFGRQYLISVGVKKDWNTREMHITPTLTIDWPDKSKCVNIKWGIGIAVEFLIFAIFILIAGSTNNNQGSETSQK